MSPRLPSPERQEAILDAALALFSERGFGETPVPAIAEKAGVGAGTIYRYWESKQDVANAVYRHWKGKLHARLTEALVPLDSAREIFRVMWHVNWNFAEEHPMAVKFLETHHHESYLDDESRAMSEEGLGKIEAVVRRAQERGEMAPGNPRILLAMANGAFVGIRKAGFVGLSDREVAELEERVWAMLAAP